MSKPTRDKTTEIPSDTEKKRQKQNSKHGSITSRTKRYDMQNMVDRIHMIGIGGVGMVGIAEVLHNLKFTVTGSDVRQTAMTRRLEGMGIDIQTGHEPDRVKTAEVVIVSTAIDTSNPEVAHAKQSRIPIIPRAEMLAELMRERYGIAVAGTHGKTTTTSLLASILTEGKKDPTYVIGGKLNQSGKNATLGSGTLLVAEADESDASFLHLNPRISIVTNIDADHMETYNGDLSKLKKIFIQFLLNLPFYGHAVICLDDANVRDIMSEVMRPITTYGFHEDADVRAVDLKTKGMTSVFQVFIRRDKSFKLTLNIPGKHNVQNALAAIAVAELLQIPKAHIKKALNEFRGVDRRFEIYDCIGLFDKDFTLVDDYGHHPTEVNAIIDTARTVFPDKRVVLLFQPHRYSRTRDLFDEFVRVLPMVDLLILMEVYPAGEKPIPQFDSKSLITQIRLLSNTKVIAANDPESLETMMQEVIQDGDVLLTMGAGDIGQLSRQWRESAESATRQV